MKTLTAEIATTLKPTENATTARNFIVELLAGHVELGEASPDADLWTRYLVELNENTYQVELHKNGSGHKERTDAAAQVLKLLTILRKNDKNLNLLMLMSHAISTATEAYQTPKLKRAKLNYKDYDIQGSMSWLNTFADWSQQWVPEAPRSWHMIAGLYAIGTLMARRVLIEGIGEEIVPVLYALIIGPSGTGKSRVARNVKLLLNKIYGLGDILIRTEAITAQAWNADAACKVALNWEEMDEEQQETERTRLLWADRRAYFSDEFGQMLVAMSAANANSSIRELNRLFLQWFSGYGDGQKTLTGDTSAGGERCLNFLGCTVEETFAKLPVNNDVFTGGILGRKIIVYESEIPVTEPVIGKITVPQTVFEPLQAMHRNLGISTCRVDPVPQTAIQQQKKTKQRYRMVRNLATPHIVDIENDPDVIQAYKNYAYDIKSLANTSVVPSPVRANYQRLPVYAVVFATFFAFSTKGGDVEWCKNPVVTMDDFAAAQWFIEKTLRPMLHSVHDKLFADEKTLVRGLEDRVLDALKKLNGKWVSFSVLHAQRVKIDRNLLNKILLEAEASQDIVSCVVQSKKRSGTPIKMYALVGTPPLEGSTGYPEWALEDIQTEEE